MTNNLIVFRESMWGHFEQGLCDPWRAKERGGRGNEDWNMMVSLTITGVEIGRAAELKGSVCFRRSQSPLYGEHEIKGGYFRLFTRDPNPDIKVKRLEYEMPFSIKGQKYFLYGYKETYDDPTKLDLLEAVQDLTTLFVTLYKYKGNSPYGEIVGTGILEYKPVELPEFMPGILPKLWARAAERREKFEFVEGIIDNLRDTYSFLRPVALPSVARDRVNELDQAWFGLTLALWGAWVVYHLTHWYSLVALFIGSGGATVVLHNYFRWNWLLALVGGFIVAVIIAAGILYYHRDWRLLPPRP